MHIISKDKLIYSMSYRNQPVVIIKPGEKVCFQTYDCFENQFDPPETSYSGIDWNRINPATGPVFIDGAEPGDILVVQIEKIELDTKGVIFSGPNEIFQESIKRNSLKRVPISDNHAVFNQKINIPLNPMIGVIGTAPKDEVVSNASPGDHGGNMDCKEIKEGTTLYLPVNVPGGLFALGDLHAAMGDGEVTSGVEVAGEVIVNIELIKEKSWGPPMAATGEHIMFIASSDLLEVAIKNAVNAMKDWLKKELKMDATEASMLLSVLGNVHICQVVNPLKTARMQMPIWVVKKYGYNIPYLYKAMTDGAELGSNYKNDN